MDVRHQLLPGCLDLRTSHASKVMISTQRLRRYSSCEQHSLQVHHIRQGTTSGKLASTCLPFSRWPHCMKHSAMLKVALQLLAQQVSTYQSAMIHCWYRHAPAVLFALFWGACQNIAHNWLLYTVLAIINVNFAFLTGGSSVPGMYVVRSCWDQADTHKTRPAML